MKHFLVFLSFLISTTSMAQSWLIETVIIITKTTPYCGGANPPEQILEEARKQKIPFGEKFYIIEGTQNVINRKIIDTLVFDSSGKCLVMLKSGCYSIITGFNFKKIEVDVSQYDMNCLQKLWSSPLFSFKVLKNKNEFTYNIAEPCAHNKPCYKGKMTLPM